MLFSSHLFVFLFLPLALLGWRMLASLPAKEPARLWLLVCSAVFYGWWSVPFLGMLLASILVNHWTGDALQRLVPSRPRAAWWLLAAGVSANLALIGWFKYSTFFGENLAALTGVELAIHGAVLPLGISFYTFQQIGFLVDAYRGTTRRYPLTDYALFVLFFPQLIAGPIVHHRELTPQFRESSTFVFRHAAFAEGLAFFVIGLAKKLLLADPMTDLSDPVFAAPATGIAPSFDGAWIGVLAYGFGLYFDFSAYSDMAVGLGRMFGLRLPYNFDSPYQATSIVDFWRRWHITLSRFLRDYLYVPLGGNRKGPTRRHVNLLLTMLIGGLWHGAAWTFVVWGGLHGLYLLVNHAWTEHGCGVRFDSVPPWLRRLGARSLTLLAVMVAWVFFRANGFGDALAILGAMFGASGVGLDWNERYGFESAPLDAFAALAAGALIALFAPNTQRMVDGATGTSMRTIGTVLPDGPARGPVAALGERLRFRPTVPWALALAAVVVASIGLMAKTREFVYFQF
jgi:alginate O-acetyltransferase complex protein AlgI